MATFEGLLDEGLLGAGGRVLELGCGAGTYVRLLAKRAHPVVGLDYSLPSLGRAVAADPSQAGRYVGGDASRLPFRDRSFQAVTCIGVLQALEGPETALAEIARVLEPAGVAVIETLGHVMNSAILGWMNGTRDARAVQAILDDAVHVLFRQVPGSGSPIR